MTSQLTGMDPEGEAALERRRGAAPVPEDILDGAPDWRELPPGDAVRIRSRILEQPDERWSGNPAALLTLAASHRSTTSPNAFAAVAYLDAADRLLTDEEPAGLHVLSRLLRAGSLRALGRLKGALTATGAAEEATRSGRIALPLAIELQGVAMVESGICLTLLGRLDDARARLMHGMALDGSHRHSAVHVEGLGCFALLEFLCGNPASARAAAERARAHGRRAGLDGHLSTAPSLAVGAILDLEAGRVDEAEASIDAVQDAASGSEYEPLAHYVRGSTLAARARWHDALDALQDMQLALRGWDDAGLLQSLHDVERAGVLITQGEGGPARRLITRVRVDGHHAFCPQRLLARLEIAAGDFPAALEATEQCLALGDDHAPHTHISVDVLRAAAHDGLGDGHAAAAAFDRALDAAARSDSRRAFAGIPPDRLNRLLADSRRRHLPEHSARLVKQLSAGMPAEQSGAEFVSPLSARERIVLDHIIAGHSARQISAQLRVSPNTVKTQVRSVYRKLGASNRHEAVDRARSFGLTG